jgi:hypothetical protein
VELVAESQELLDLMRSGWFDGDRKAHDVNATAEDGVTSQT